MSKTDRKNFTKEEEVKVSKYKHRKRVMEEDDLDESFEDYQEFLKGRSVRASQLKDLE